MPDRISVDIEGLRDDLERLAEESERTLNQMIRLFVRQGIKRSPPPSRSDTSKAAEFLRHIAEGERPSDVEIAEAAHESDIDEQRLMELCSCLLKTQEGNES
ncbi:MAG: hypothetical protein F6K31_07265 [Symploca sp. SIO2G7]|nr:hypothetical protein [Symploca sp. SIO2G7]